MTPETNEARLAPPAAERRPHVITAHGDSRTDDWYWIGDRDDPAVLPLLEAENAYTEQATAHLQPLVDDIYAAMLAKTKLTDVTHPAPRGEWAYYWRTVEGLEHSIFCRRPAASGLPSSDPDDEDTAETVLLDENAMAVGHEFFEIGDMALSADQRLIAYAVDTTGGERLRVRIKEIESGEDLADVIDDTYYGLAFAGNDTLFYTRPDHAMRPHQIWRHKLGTEASADALVWEEPDERFFLSAQATKDGKYVRLHAQSRVTSESRLVPTADPEAEPFVVEARRQDVLYSVVHHRGELLVLSNDGGENFLVYTTPVGEPGRSNWRVLLPHRDDVRLEGIDVVDGFAIVEERGHATTALRVIPLTAAAVDDEQSSGHLIEAPEAGTVFLAENLDYWATEVRFETTDLVTPRRLHAYRLADGDTTLLRTQPVPGYDPARYATERRWAKSSDGTEVPVTIAWAVDRPSGPGPCLLYGYGSYEASTDPLFRTDRPIHPLLDRGGVYAIAHVRGGGEMGRQWYLDGRIDKKPNTFEDFVSVAAYLVDEGLTTSGQLAALGGSAGGLLMGASMNLAPERFACIVAEVPFVDCLTTMLDTTLPLTVTEQEEWGDPIADESAYEVIKSYSPYDNVREVRYPKTLVTGGLNDPRVSYFEPTKWVQRLRSAHADNAGRVFLRMELSAGHSGPSGRYQSWKKRALVLAFVIDAIGAAETATN